MARTIQTQEPEIPHPDNVPYIVMFTQEGGTFAAHSNHPRIGTTHSPDYRALRRTIDALIKTLPDDVMVALAATMPADLVDEDIESDTFLAADEPTQAYKTVDGSERLPATDETDRQERDDSDPKTRQFRSDPSINVVGVGHVTSTRSG